MKKLITLIGTLALGCGLLAAQNQPATATQPDGSTQTATTRQDNAPKDRDWGWIGLLGLAGLAGLRGRRDTRVATEDDRNRAGVRRVA
jgi:MYXO-CTERM domain-containing protein